MRLPKSWNEITVEQFQECYFVLGKNPGLDSWILVLSILSGKSKDYFENIPIDKLKGHIKKLNFLLNPDLNTKVNKFVTIRGKVFKAVLFANELKTNQVADIKGFMVKEGQSLNDTVVENAHKLLASIYVPLTFKGFNYTPSKHSKVSNYFRKAKMGEVYGTLFFYSENYKNLMKATQDFGESQLKIVKDHEQELMEWSKTLEADGVGR